MQQIKRSIQSQWMMHKLLSKQILVLFSPYTDLSSIKNYTVVVMMHKIDEWKTLLE
jgi:hypothetical protein